MPKSRVLPLPLGISFPRMGCGKYWPLRICVSSSFRFLSRCDFYSMTFIPSTPPAPLFRITSLQAVVRFAGCNMRSIKFIVLLLFYFILKYSIPYQVSLGLVSDSCWIRPPLKTDSNVEFSPSPNCETSVYLITACFS